jgi:alkylation response protein AidB-like acyl-CoA dehydrogenase
MDLRFTPEDERFRDEARAWLEDNLADGFDHLRGRGGPGDEDEALFDDRLAWEQRMGAAGWTCVGWPEEHGGRGLSLHREVIFNEEYARARAPGRMNHIGETLLGPTVIAFGSAAQKARFLPPIVRVQELWCQGYSEPNAGSDLANVQTRAERDGDEWVITGQKIWTSHAHVADWCFVLCRTNREAPRHKGISYLLVPLDQPGVDIRPIRQLTGTAEFSEVFFDGARTAAENVVGAVDGGWGVAMGTLAFERGASTLGQQLSFRAELEAVIAAAKANGAAQDPTLRRRLADAWMGLSIMRANTLRVLSQPDGQAAGADLSPAALITKIYWATWHRALGKLAMDVLGCDAEIAEGAPYELSALQKLFLFTRSDTIYAGSNQIQRNIIGERALGLPREPRP